jgi:hypothetical protein
MLMSVRTRVVLLSLSVMLMALVSSRGAAAQAVTDTAATAALINSASPTVVDAGPTTQSLSVGVQRQAAQPAATPAAARGRSGLGQPEALMIVGGAALLLGAVIGDDPGTILMIGGAIVFLAGLYKYLQ